MHKINTLALVFCVSIFGAMLSISEAATYYTSIAQGSDSNAGNQGSPFKTINKGLSVMGAGDTLYIGQGQYNEEISSNNTKLPVGTSWNNPVTIAAAPGEHPLIMGRLVLNASYVAYMIFDGLILDGSNFGGTAEVVYQSNSAHHIRIVDCEIRQAGGQGVQNGDAGPGLEYLHNRIHHNGRNHASDGSESHGMYLSAPGMLLDGNEVYQNPGYGIQLYHRGASRGDDSVLRNNYIHDNTGSGAGVVIAMASRVQFYNNAVINNAHGGLDISYGSPTGTVVSNNTFSGPMYAVSVFHSARGTVVSNNLTDMRLQGNETAFVDSTGDVVFTANHCRTAGPGCAVIGDPQLTNPGAGDIHVQRGSVVIGAGRMISGMGGLMTDYYGAARSQSGPWDIGAAVFAGTPVAPGLPAPSAVTVTFPHGGAAPAAVLTWQYPPDLGQTQFVIYAQQRGGKWAKRGVVAPHILTFTDTEMTPAQPYCWVIRAEKGQEESPPGQVCDTVPAAPVATGVQVLCQGAAPEGSTAFTLTCTLRTAPVGR